MFCVACGTKLPEDAAFCFKCGRKVPGISNTSRALVPEGLDPETLPTYLAWTWRSFLLQPEPRLGLIQLLRLVEDGVRFSVALGLAEVVEAEGGVVSSSLASQIRDHVERPTLGRWVHVLRSVLDAFPNDPRLVRLRSLEASLGELFPPREQATEETCLLTLRNGVAHSSLLTSALAATYLEKHRRRCERFLEAVQASLHGTRVVAASDEGTHLLLGPEPRPVSRPDPLPAGARGPYLVGEGGCLPLTPLATFAPVQVVGPDGLLVVRPPPGPHPQLYLRNQDRSLRFSPITGKAFHSEDPDLVARFRELFRLDEAPRIQVVPGEFDPDHYLHEARLTADQLIGRVQDLRRVKAWLKGRDGRAEDQPRLAWIQGGPGLGKSTLMASVAKDLANAPRDRQLTFVYRFRMGDGRRNTRRSLLQYLQAALCAWDPLRTVTQAPSNDVLEGEALLQDVKQRLEQVADLTPSRDRAPPPRVVALVDGLDEVAASDREVVRVLLRLAVPGTVWLLAGRPEFGLPEALAVEQCETLFPGDLPPMSAEDIRLLLMDRLKGSASEDLLKRDVEVEGQRVENPFVERVTERAGGLPLYVHLLLEDLERGVFTVQDEDELPRGLLGYYDALLENMGLSDVKRDLPLVVSILGRAQEPLDADALALLFARGDADKLDRWRPRVEDALRAGRALLRAAGTSEGTSGHTLYHQSFRDYLAAQSLRENSGSKRGRLSGTLEEAEDLLIEAANWWSRLPQGNLRNHLFRWGTEYGLWWGGEPGADAVRQRLTEFSYLQSRTRALPSSEVTDLVDEYTQLQAREDDPEQRIWQAFFRERAHLLRRGTSSWPVNRILLQLAVEHADDSPVTQGAETWLEAGACEWNWYRNRRRPAQTRISPCLATLEGHKGVDGAMILTDGSVLSWSSDKTLRVWDPATGTCLAILKGHTGSVGGALVLDGGRVLSWSDYHDGTLRVWDPQTGTCLATLEGHTKQIGGVLALTGGRVLSWSKDGTLRLWELANRTCVTTLDCHRYGVEGVLALGEGRALSWGRHDKRLLVWDLTTSTCLATLKGHSSRVLGALVMDERRILSWSDDGTLRIWDQVRWTCLAEGQSVEGEHSLDPVHGALTLDDGKVLFWLEPRFAGKLRVWDPGSGASLVLDGHSQAVSGALVLDGGEILSWSWDGMLRVWDPTSGICLVTLEGHTRTGTDVNGALLLDGGRVLSWAWDGTICLWDLKRRTLLGGLEAHSSPVNGALALDTNRILSWSVNGTIRVWDLERGSISASLEGYSNKIKDVLELSNGLVLSWYADYSKPNLRVWDPVSGACLATLRGQLSGKGEAKELSGWRILAWGAQDMNLRVWDSVTGTCLMSLEGHTDQVLGALVLGRDRVLSYSADGTLRLWDLAGGLDPTEGLCLVTLAGHTDEVIGACALGDEQVLSWSGDETLRVWDMGRGSCITTLEGHSGPVQDAWAFGEHILSWSNGRYVSDPDPTIMVWDAGSGACIATLEGHTNPVSGVIALQDGRRALSWSEDGTLRLWDPIQGDCLAILEGHTNSVVGARAMDKDRVLSWSVDATLRLWDVVSGVCLATLEGHTDWIYHSHILDGGRILSWSSKEILVWSAPTPEANPVAAWLGDEIQAVAIVRRSLAIGTSRGEMLFLELGSQAKGVKQQLE